jgi:lysozyme
MDTALNLIKRFEGLKLEAYPDRKDVSKAVWTIGYGTTQGIEPGMKISEADAEDYLEREVSDLETRIKILVKRKLSEREMAALVSLVYNIGIERFKFSTLLKDLNAGQMLSAAFEFSRWVYIDGKPSPGLINRRKVEHGVFLS